MGGIRTTTLIITQDGDKLTADNDGNELTGSASGETFELSGMHAAQNGRTAEVKMNGELKGDGLKGEASWSGYEMVFTAKRAE